MLVTVFVLLNILLSVVMDLFNSVSAERRARQEYEYADDSPSFFRAVTYAMLTSRKQLRLAAAGLREMRAAPKPRLHMRHELREGGVHDATLFVLFETLGSRHAQQRIAAGAGSRRDGNAGGRGPLRRADTVNRAGAHVQARLRRALRKGLSAPALVRRVQRASVWSGRASSANKDELATAARACEASRA